MKLHRCHGDAQCNGCQCHSHNPIIAPVRVSSRSLSESANDWTPFFGVPCGNLNSVGLGRIVTLIIRGEPSNFASSICGSSTARKWVNWIEPVQPAPWGSRFFFSIDSSLHTGCPFFPAASFSRIGGSRKIPIRMWQCEDLDVYVGKVNANYYAGYHR